MLRAWIGIGSNLGDPVARVQAAQDALRGLADGGGFRASGLYRSRPWGGVEQPDFVNAVASFFTRTDAEALLAALQRLEKALGRQRNAEQRWGPRKIDLDLLLLGDLRVCSPTLELPHPHLHERGFVLAPLAEIAPDLAIPGRGTVQQCLDALDEVGAWPVDETPPDPSAQAHRNHEA